MPEFNFKLSNSEIDQVISYIYSQGIYMVIDRLYPVSDAPLLHTKSEYHAFSIDQLTIKSYIMRDDYHECPLIYNSIIKDGDRGYFVNDRSGGPYIILVWNKKMNAGNCSYYPSYYYENINYEHHRPPAAMVQLYKDIFKYIRKKCTIVKYYNRRVYCGKEYIEQVRDGTITKVEEDFKELILSLPSK